MVKIIHNEELNEQTLRSLKKDEIDWIYNALDVCVTYEVAERQRESIDEIALNTSNFSHTLAAPVFEMSLRGTRIDKEERRNELARSRANHKKIEHNLSRLITEGVGLPNFNYRSIPQLKAFFYGVLSCTPVKARNAAGQYTPVVNREALEKFQRHWFAIPFAKHILALRDLDKRISFLETEIDSDGRMRTSYNIAGTNTGRLSSSASDYGTGTNNQNVDRALRKIFIADEGKKFCNIDLEQADARNVGAIIWENFVEDHGEAFAGAYLDACESGDLHTQVCRMAWRDLKWGEDPSLYRSIADQIAYRDMSYRDLAKRLGHGTNYYGTPRTMALHTKVDIKIIETFQRRYFSAFPAIGNFSRDAGDNWHSWVRQQLVQYGHITTPYFKRRRYFFGRPEEDSTLREAIAYAPQSMTADQIDTGVIRLWRELPEVELLIQVHDSILFQYPVELEDEIVPRALELLKVRIPLKKGREFFVPTEAKIGWNWADQDAKKTDRDGKAENYHGLIKWKGPGKDQRAAPDRIERSNFEHALLTKL